MPHHALHAVLADDEHRFEDLNALYGGALEWHELIETREHDHICVAASHHPDPAIRQAAIRRHRTRDALEEHIGRERNSNVIAAALTHPMCDTELVTHIVNTRNTLSRGLCVAIARAGFDPDKKQHVAVDDTASAAVLDTIGAHDVRLNGVERLCVARLCDSVPRVSTQLATSGRGGVFTAMAAFAHHMVEAEQFDVVLAHLTAHLPTGRYTNDIYETAHAVWQDRVYAGVTWCIPHGYDVQRLEQLRAYAARVPNLRRRGQHPTVSTGVAANLIEAANTSGITHDHLLEYHNSAPSPAVVNAIIACGADEAFIDVLAAGDPMQSLKHLSAAPAATFVPAKLRGALYSAAAKRYPKHAGSYEHLIYDIDIAELRTAAVAVGEHTRQRARAYLVEHLGCDLDTPQWRLAFELGDDGQLTVSELVAVCEAAV